MAQLPVDVPRSVHRACLAAARAAKDTAEADSGSLTSEETVKAAPVAGCTMKVQADVETAPRSDADAPVGASSGYFSF